MSKKYKLKHRPPPIERLLKYREWNDRPPLTDDPPGIQHARSWEQGCRMLYEHMMAQKRGTIPPGSRRGLWFYLLPPMEYRP